ncbi:unnamed protein product [Chrysodeixis includens]|uniref:Uncharacterized protein n=1 Tax=Chrysodeixis includens TaxID=689277 RepID=A0A9P0FWG6_CHRIL|nr:unnamed protein product [Chrysodeixis includens]
MCDLEICRICLSKGVRVYFYKEYNLKLYYEDIMRKRVDEDGLPKYFCYECAAMLCKYRKFKEKCITGQRELRELLWNGSISSSSVSLIDRKGKNLASSIGLVTRNKRVKTYTVKNKTITRNLSKDFHHFQLPEIEEIKVDYDSDTLTDKNLAIIKDEMMNEIESDSVEIFKLDEQSNSLSIKEETNQSLEICNGDEINTESFADDEKTDIKEDEESDHLMMYDAGKVSFDIQFNDEKISENDGGEKLCENAGGEKISENGEDETINKGQVKAKKFEVLDGNKNDLNPNHWLKINLNEEEALDEFRARAQDLKYLSAAYKCEFCFKGFSKEDMLNRHRELRHSESVGPIDCHFCHMRFKIKCHLTRHITQHYTKYKCLRCDLMCPLKNTALFHNDYHNGVIRKCMHCGEEFRHLSTYYTHLRTHRSEHVCTLCGASFVSVKGLNMHKRTMHVNTVINPEEEQSYCERCDIQFETQKAYEEHLFHSAKHTEGVEDLANERPAQSIPKHRKKSLRRNPRKFTPCTICNKTFSTQTAYRKHHATEHKDAPLPKDNEKHVCEICGVSLATHTGEKPFSCTLCDKRFTQKCSMKLHYRTFHLKEPYPKRNRRKKGGSPLEPSFFDDFRNGEDSEESLKINLWR